MVQEIWFKKSGWPEKKVVLYYKSTFFQVGEKWLTRRKKIRVWRTTFLEPLFYTFPEMRSQNKRSSGKIGVSYLAFWQKNNASKKIWEFFVQEIFRILENLSGGTLLMNGVYLFQGDSCRYLIWGWQRILIWEKSTNMKMSRS